MFGISFEHILIVGVILIIVGPKRLPELGNTMGKAIKNFKDSFAGIEEASFKRLPPEADDAPLASQGSTDGNPKTAMATGGTAVPPNSPIATEAPLAAGAASLAGPASSDPHKN